MIGGFFKPGLFQLRLLSLLTFIQHEADQVETDLKDEGIDDKLKERLDIYYKELRALLCVFSSLITVSLVDKVEEFHQLAHGNTEALLASANIKDILGGEEMGDPEEFIQKIIDEFLGESTKNENAGLDTLDILKNMGLRHSQMKDDKGKSEPPPR